MSSRTKSLCRWTTWIAASLVLLNGLFWTWFGIACAWPDPLGMLMHTLVPGLPMIGFGVVCWRWPVAGGSVLALWGTSPLLVLVGGRPFFSYPGNWFSITPLLVYGVPLVAGVLLIISAIILQRSSYDPRNWP